MRADPAGRPVVHTWDPNSNAGKPLFTLMEKGVEFEHRYTDILEFEQHAPDYLAINPNGTVPSLVHDGVVFAESTPMCEYIDRAFRAWLGRVAERPAVVRALARVGAAPPYAPPR